MKVAFMGTPQFAVPTLDSLVAEHEVLAVFTQPDRPAGRGKKMRASAVKTAALEHGIAVYQPNNINGDDVVAKLKALAVDVIVVVAYGQILKQAILDLPQYGCLNVHASLLPRWRGASPIQSAIVAGDSQSGVTIMQMDRGLDTGDILNVLTTPIAANATAGQLHDQLMMLGARALLATLDNIERGFIKPQKQNEALATYAPLIEKSQAIINWQADVKTIVNLIRGYNPWPSAQTTLAGVNLKVHRATALIAAPETAPGTVERIDQDYIYISCTDGLVRLEEIQPQNKKSMTVAAYLRGHHIALGSKAQIKGR